MLTLEKSSGLTKLGRREKSILLLMLKGDDPPGKPNPIWFDIYSEFGINYNSLPKKYQQKFREERSFRLSIHRLAKKGLVRPVSIVPNGCSLTDPRGYGYSFYSLTQTGHQAAEKIRWDENATKSQIDLEETMILLKVRGAKLVTISQVREMLWQRSHDKFASREEFEKYWNEHKLGFSLKKYSSERKCISMKDGRRKYLLKI
jgi:hypothetical protein